MVMTPFYLLVAARNLKRRGKRSGMLHGILHLFVVAGFFAGREHPKVALANVTLAPRVPVAHVPHYPRRAPAALDILAVVGLLSK